MLMAGGNGGWQRPGEGVYHTQTNCPVVLRYRSSLEWVKDVNEIEQCTNCRNIEEENQQRRYFGQG
jgi:hypothetical protein